MFRSFIPAVCSLILMSPIAHAGDNDIDTSCFEPALIDSNDQLVNPSFMTIRDGLAYIIDNFQNDLVIIDLTTPGFPILSRNSSFSFINNIALKGNTAYISSGNSYDLSDDGFSVWDIEDPTDPWFIRPYEIDVSNTFTIVHNDILLHNNELSLNVARQRAPRINDSATFPLSGPIIHINENTAYAFNLAIYDITDPSNPIELSPRIEPPISFEQIQTSGSIIIARDGSDFSIYEHTSPSSIQLQNSFTAIGATDFVLRGSMIFITAPDGLSVFDLSNPSDPMPISTHTNQPALEAPSQIELVDNLFYITSETGTLAAYQINTNPVGTYHTPAAANEIELSGDLALIAHDQGLSIFDISDPTIPTLRSNFPTADTAVGLDISGTTAYLATHQSGLDIVDVSDPSNPTLITNYNPGRSTQDIQIVGDLAYVVNRITGLHILDISNPSSPLVLSITDTPARAEDITIHENIALISHGTFDLQILDVSNPTSPTIVGTISPLDSADFGIDATTVHDGLLYTAENSGGYRVWEFSNPATPIELATINTDIGTTIGFGREITFRDSILILANGSGGLSIYNNTDPTNPTLIVNHKARETTASDLASFRRIALRDDLAFTTVLNGGFRIFDFLGCHTPCPVDFNNDTVINFFDISIFLSAFNTQDPLADLNLDGNFDFFDVSIVFGFFSSGCP
jgi:hypothetical protein